MRTWAAKHSGADGKFDGKDDLGLSTAIFQLNAEWREDVQLFTRVDNRVGVKGTSNLINTVKLGHIGTGTF
jgi:hypothetical protein